MHRSRRDGGLRRTRFGAAGAIAAIFVLGAVSSAEPARADDPPALGKPVAVNDTLPRIVLGGVTQPGVATTPEATAARIGFFTATPTDTTLNFSVVSQTDAVPAAGMSTSTAIYLLTADGGTYRASSLADGTFGVSQSVDGVFKPVGTATIAVQGQVTEIDVQSGAWAAAGTTVLVVRRDLDASMNGFESATPPILLDALSDKGFGGAVPLNGQGTVLAADGLTNTPCAIASMPTVSLDAATKAVTFTFAGPAPANLRGTIGGVSLADLINPPYISGSFADPTWAGSRDGTSVGDFAVSAAGNSFTVTTSNESGSIFAANHDSLTIGMQDASGCYSLSPAVPFAQLLAPVGEVVVAPSTTAGATSTSPGTTNTAGSSVTTTAGAGPAAGETTTTTASVTFDNSDTDTPWTAIIIVGLLAVLVGIGGGMMLSRRDRRTSDAREALFTARPRTKSAPGGDVATAPEPDLEPEPESAPGPDRALRGEGQAAESDDDVGV